MWADAVMEDHDRAVVIVHYKAVDETGRETYNGGGPPQNPAVLLQVCLRRENVSPSGKLVRLGRTRGDEIVGWTKLQALEVIEVLGILSDDGETVVPIVPRETVDFGVNNAVA